MKNYNATTYVLGLVGLYVTVYIARMAWEKAGEKDEVKFSGKR